MSFLPDDYLECKAQRRANAICAVLFLLVMAGIGSAFSISERSTRRLDAEHAAVEQQYLSEAKRIEQVKQMQEKQRRMAHQAELTASLLEKVPRSYLLAEITNSMPTGVSLLDFIMDSRVRSKPAAANAAPKTAYEQKKATRDALAQSAQPAQVEVKAFDVSVKITGIANNDVQVSQFLSRLARSKVLRDVNLLQTEEFAQGEEKLRKFQIELMLDPSAQVEVGDKPTRTTSVEIETK